MGNFTDSDHSLGVDDDPQETEEWLQALDAVLAAGGTPRRVG